MQSTPVSDNLAMVLKGKVQSGVRFKAGEEDIKAENSQKTRPATDAITRPAETFRPAIGKPRFNCGKVNHLKVDCRSKKSKEYHTEFTDT